LILSRYLMGPSLPSSTGLEERRTLPHGPGLLRVVPASSSVCPPRGQFLDFLTSGLSVKTHRRSYWVTTAAVWCEEVIGERRKGDGSEQTMVG
jgi:hypothetical protein